MDANKNKFIRFLCAILLSALLIAAGRYLALLKAENLEIENEKHQAQRNELGLGEFNYDIP